MRCTVCGREGETERHHLAGRKNSANAIVDLCAECHREQTDRQWQLGVLSRRDRERSDVTVLHALLEGITGVCGAQAHHFGQDQLVPTGQRWRHSTLQLLALISEEPPGPRPITNDRNAARRTRNARPHRSAQLPSPTLHESAEAMASILPVLARAVSELLPGTEEAHTAIQLAAGFEQIARGLLAIEEHPRAADLAAARDRAGEVGVALIEQLAREVAAVGLEADAQPSEELVARAREFRAVSRSWLGFAARLAEAGPNGIEEAVARFLGDQPPS